jgi:hypothetical protein
VRSKGGPRWIAFASNESGREEVYASNFPEGDHKWQVSSGGGSLPHWRGDGSELFYVSSDNKLMSVLIGADDTFHADSPKVLFSVSMPAPASYPELPGNNYAVTRDGGRFLVNRTLNDAVPSVTVILSTSP